MNKFIYLILVFVLFGAGYSLLSSRQESASKKSPDNVSPKVQIEEAKSEIQEERQGMRDLDQVVPESKPKEPLLDDTGSDSEVGQNSDPEISVDPDEDAVELSQEDLEFLKNRNFHEFLEYKSNQRKAAEGVVVGEEEEKVADDQLKQDLLNALRLKDEDLVKAKEAEQESIEE
ncbi:MAG: hypothetical protein H6619_06205 [Deltaproteobacteria bacterium]|nr:hypothetical protein [Deltaproteobacteria bacterium]